MKSISILYLFLLLGVFNSCNSSKKASQETKPEDTITSNAWVLDTWFSNDSLKTMHTLDTIELLFDESNMRLNGSDGCNTFIASFGYESNFLIIKMGAGTKKYCGEASAKDEQLLHQFLGSKPSYQIKNGVLILSTAKDKLHFNPKK
jgi:heat shock protein HslJ